MSDDAAKLGKQIAELRKRIAELEAQLAPKELFKPREPWRKIDWTEGMKMPASAAQEMARVVPDVKGAQTAEQVQSSWARSRIGGPGGFGPPDGNWDKPQAQPKSEPKPAQDNRSPQMRIFDAMVDYWAGGPNDASKLRSR